MNYPKLAFELLKKLDITWEDEDTNAKLETIINDAKVILDYKLGANIDYSENGMEHNLFLNYCMYAWNNCTNEFDSNYLNELLQIRAMYEVMQYEEEEV